MNDVQALERDGDTDLSVAHGQSRHAFQESLPHRTTSPDAPPISDAVAPPASARQHYFSVRMKFFIALASALLWATLSVYIAQPWIQDLARHITYPLALFLIAAIAIIPGYMNAFLVAALLLDRRPRGAVLPLPYPAISILIAAYQEEGNILGTLESIEKQAYPGAIQVIVINDGSTDETAALVRGAQRNYSWLELIDLQQNGGKAKALNSGLERVKHEIVITVDGDSYLYRDALKNIVQRYVKDPPNTVAVAGSVLARNSRLNWITMAQEWDYFHGIASIKRIQSLFQGTLVAQGAFSLYDKATLVKIGGWPDCVGEDIVMTWAMLKAGRRVGHCEDACVFTNVPDSVGKFVRQRRRWSRGMIEAFRHHPTILFQPHLSTQFVYWNLLFPVLDLVFTMVFIPGLLLALFGYFWIAGPMTVALLPLAALINLLMFSIGRKMFDENELKVRRNPKGLLIYALVYSLVLQPACLMGYFSELFKFKKTWGTK